MGQGDYPSINHERQEHVRYNERMKLIYELYLTKEYLDLG